MSRRHATGPTQVNVKLPLNQRRNKSWVSSSRCSIPAQSQSINQKLNQSMVFLYRQRAAVDLLARSLGNWSGGIDWFRSSDDVWWRRSTALSSHGTSAANEPPTNVTGWERRAKRQLDAFWNDNLIWTRRGRENGTTKRANMTSADRPYWWHESRKNLINWQVSRVSSETGHFKKIQVDQKKRDTLTESEGKICHQYTRSHARTSGVKCHAARRTAKMKSAVTRVVLI